MSWRVRIAWHETSERLGLQAVSLARRWYYAGLGRRTGGAARDAPVVSASQLNSKRGPGETSGAVARLRVGRRAAMSLWTSARLRRYPQDAGQDQASYVQWLIARGEPARLRPRSLAGLSGASARGAEKHEPLFSVVVPVFRPPLWGLERCVVSVLTQRFGNFELKICDDCGGDRDVVELLRRCEAMDDRLELVVSDRNGGISDATNRALALATGKYVVFLDHDDELAEDALSVIAAAINARPEADVLYSDSDKISAGGQRFAPALKPAWSPDLLCSGMYLGHVLVVRRTLVEKVGGLRSDYDGSQDHDLALRVTEIADSVVHIPRILYHWRAGVGSAAANPVAKPWAREAGRSAVAEALRRRGEQATVEHDPRAVGRYHCTRRLGAGAAVTVALFAREPVGSVAGERAKHRWDTHARELLATAGMSQVHLDLSNADGNSGLGWVPSSIAALQAAGTDLVVLLESELLPLSRDWARALVAIVDRPGVGAAGGCVIEGSRLANAGFVAGLDGSVGPVLVGLPTTRPGYQAMAIAQREISALSAACIVVRRDAVVLLNQLPSALSADLAASAVCFLLQRAGERVLYEPSAMFKRPQRRRQARRGSLDSFVHKDDVDWFLSEFAGELAQGDPFYHPALSLADPYCHLGPPDVGLPLLR